MKFKKGDKVRINNFCCLDSLRGQNLIISSANEQSAHFENRSSYCSDPYKHLVLVDPPDLSGPLGNWVWCEFQQRPHKIDYANCWGPHSRLSVTPHKHTFASVCTECGESE